MPDADKEITDNCACDEAADNAVIKCGADKMFFILALHVLKKVLCSASDIAYAHCCRNAVASNFSEAFNLNAAGKGYK